MIKNLRIGSKLILLVSIAIISSVILAGVGLFNISGLGNDVEDTYNLITVPTGYAAEMGLIFSDVRVSIRDLALSSTMSENAEYTASFEAANEKTKEIIGRYRDFLSQNNINEGEEYDLVKSISDDYEGAQEIMDRAIALGNKNMNSAAAVVIKEEFFAFASVIQQNIEKLVHLNENQSIESNENSFETVRISEIMLIGVTAIALLILAILSFVIIKSITRPVKLMVDAAESMAAGNLNINLRADSKDEIGVLADRFIKVAATINDLTSDLDRLSHAHEEGDLDSRIDSGKYKGAYNGLAVGLNGMLESYVDSIKEILECVGGFGEGNFNARISTFPGKKAIINKAIETLRSNMNHVSGDINKLVGAALEGDLELRADDSMYKGDWAKIIKGLNDVLNAISMPIVEASDVMIKLSEGDFSYTVKGDYKGSFGMIKETLNLTVKNISAYIKEIASTLTEISRDNLDVRITGEYVGDFVSIKDAINSIADRLNKVMSDINSAAEQVAAGAKQISESSMTLAMGASEQASSVEQLTATITSVNEQTRQNAENSQQADSLSTESKNNAAEGNIEMENMLNSIRGIKEASQNISKVIKVIEDISLQTNLLALNAAVEAARAGQYGKGFSVVAEEVRSLAAKSQNSVVETAALIDDTINKVEEGTRIAAKTSDALSKIVTAVTGVSGIITEINVASNEQAVSISQIMEGTNQISNVVQQNSATSEESAAAAQQLSGQADVLRSMISAFKLRSADKQAVFDKQAELDKHPTPTEKQGSDSMEGGEAKPTSRETLKPDRPKDAPVVKKEPERVRKPEPKPEPKPASAQTKAASVTMEDKPVAKQPVKPAVKPADKVVSKPEKQAASTPARSEKSDAAGKKDTFVSAKPIISAASGAGRAGGAKVQSSEAIYGASDFGKY